MDHNLSREESKALLGIGRFRYDRIRRHGYVTPQSEVVERHEKEEGERMEKVLKTAGEMIMEEYEQVIEAMEKIVTE